MTKQYLNTPPLKVLKEVWGYESFRENQEEAVKDIIEGTSDILFLAKTGAGKSLIAQLPSLVLEGTVLVISPLLALMDDQVISSPEAVRATTINSTTGIKLKREIKENLKNDSIDILYMAPESILNPEMLSLLTDQCNISRIIYDEVHCISSYGSSFRPKYKQIGKTLRTVFPNIPITGLTATADEQTLIDISNNLSFDSKFPLKVYKQNLDRPSISYNVLEKNGNGLKQIKEIIDSYPKNSSGLIYCATRKSVEELQYQLYKLGYKVTMYHAGLSKKKKLEAYNDWMSNKKPIAVCTTAFGTGINKSNVRYVINQSIPHSLEDLLQLQGRASRDELPSSAYLLYDQKDVSLLQWIVKQSTKNQEYLKVQLEKINQVSKFAKSKTCLRKQMLEHFGQEYKRDNCESCSNCISSVKL